jgi:hypothetical protein
MAPRKPQLATAAAAQTEVSSFPGWDALVAEAQEQGAHRPKDPYVLPLPTGKAVEIPPLDADRYLAITAAQRRGDTSAIFEALFPDSKDRIRVRTALKGAPFDMVDVVAGKVLRYFFGLGIESQEKAGNSPAS